jgi:hypothetical protein
MYLGNAASAKLAQGTFSDVWHMSGRYDPRLKACGGFVKSKIVSNWCGLTGKAHAQSYISSKALSASQC